jgi:uncharacterized protein (DUF924 family)
MNKEINRILNFWFEYCQPKDWFKKNIHFDNKIKHDFGELVEDALLGYIRNWQKSLEGSLAFIILTDQFTRNIYRQTPKSFSGDKFALDACMQCIEKFDLSNKKKEWSQFILIPLMHSESLIIQEISLPLFKAHTSQKVYQYALKHKDVIAKFGRFPHRNSILGRTSTKSEIDFLKGPGSSF